MKQIKFTIRQSDITWVEGQAKLFKSNNSKEDNRGDTLRHIHAQAGLPEAIMAERGEWGYVIDQRVDAIHPEYGPIEVKMLNKDGEFKIPTAGKRWFIEQQRGHVNGFLFLQYDTPAFGGRVWEEGEEIIVNIHSYKTYEEVMGKPPILEEFEGDLKDLKVFKTAADGGLRKKSSLNKYVAIVAEKAGLTSFWILDDRHGSTASRHLATASGKVVKEI